MLCFVSLHLDLHKTTVREGHAKINSELHQAQARLPARLPAKALQTSPSRLLAIPRELSAVQERPRPSVWRRSRPLVWSPKALSPRYVSEAVLLAPQHQERPRPSVWSPAASQAVERPRPLPRQSPLPKKKPQKKPRPLPKKSPLRQKKPLKRPKLMCPCAFAAALCGGLGATRSCGQSIL